MSLCAFLCHLTGIYLRLWPGILKVGTSSTDRDGENLRGCAGKGLRAFSSCLWIITVVPDTWAVLQGALTLAEDGCALSDDEVRKAVTVEKRLENCLGKRWEAAKIQHIQWTGLTLMCCVCPRGLLDVLL